MAATNVRNFSKLGDGTPVPNLTRVQSDGYRRFLQLDKGPHDRNTEWGLESLLREVFPIESYDGTMKLTYQYYVLEEPRYTPDECRELRLTFGMPFRVCVSLEREGHDPATEEIYLGEFPIMMGGGEFIVNGAERVIVSQLHRSPGVDFSIVSAEGDRPLHSTRIIPERGSWIELEVTKKDVLAMRIDQSTKLAATTFLRCLDESISSTDAILGLFYEVNEIPAEKVRPEHWAAASIVDTETGEELVHVGRQIGEAAEAIVNSKLKKVRVIQNPSDPLILNTVAEERLEQFAEFGENDYERALIKIYTKLRPGNPPQVEKAKQLFLEKFYDDSRYRLGRVGRFRINRKFNLNVPEDAMFIRAEDFLKVVTYLLDLRSKRPDPKTGRPIAQVDDIDHLGNRRLRTLDELAVEELRKGFLKLRRTVQERMSVKDPDELAKIADLVNSKSISSAIDFFFGRSELSQVVDQTNPLSSLVHERRLSALGPGGLNRKRAGFEVRDVHISHYGRICPIETPEGTNIGLISSLGIYASVDEYGFIRTPYRLAKDGKLTGKNVDLRADEEIKAILAPADSLEKDGRLHKGAIMARVDGELTEIDSAMVEFVDIAPKQIVGVSAALIPFLEHDDANRALMGSNMQRQAVPLLVTEQPLVGTGMEEVVARNSSMVIRARKAGTIKFVDAQKIVIGDEVHRLRKYEGLNERTCLNQVPLVLPGQKVEKGQIIADGAATQDGVLALGRNLVVAFMPWDGYNYEDAILISERLVREDVFTSIHIDEFEIEIRETKLGREEFTRDIPNVSEKMLRNLDERGVIRLGARVGPGDILVGKVSPKSKSELTPEEKLLHAIFGRAGEDVKNASLEVPIGVEGIVIAAEKYSRKVNLTEQERSRNLQEIKEAEIQFLEQYRESTRTLVQEAGEALGKPLTDTDGKTKVEVGDGMLMLDLRRIRDHVRALAESHDDAKIRAELMGLVQAHTDKIEEAETDKNKLVNRLSRGDELPNGVLEMVKVYVSTKRKVSVGDKMAGRHGNKGVISKVLPLEDMPFLDDGQPVDIVLNPLGVPSRLSTMSTG
ncbi:MAG TPA: DNA-directed RNA polymerase subunit beta, partial [Phycisphaerales bacterium]|nr:DNA-directed RNA polymerase subunit beta [Phycisphaerales bacterium]